MSSALERLAGPSGPLQAEPPDADEYAGLLHSGTARLMDAKRAANSIESRFDLAYNAAHALCLAALRRHGYRSSKRYIVFQVLEHTLGLAREEWLVLDRAHNLRNIGEYEGDLRIDERFLGEMIAVVEVVLEKLAALGPP